MFLSNATTPKFDNFDPGCKTFRPIFEQERSDNKKNQKMSTKRSKLNKQKYLILPCPNNARLALLERNAVS
jgi:hypothetical protein